jgi:hypothetical protein
MKMHTVSIVGTELREEGKDKEKEVTEKLVKHEIEVEELAYIEIDGKLIFSAKKGVIAQVIK